MINIYMDNVFSVCENIPKNIINIISEELSFESGGFGAPKQTKYLYNQETNTTFTGLVPRIIKTLHKRGLKYDVVDNRIKPASTAGYKIIKGFEARDYQEEIIVGASSREIIQAATGAGKTFIMASLIVKFDVKSVLVIAPKVSLAEQIKEEFEKFLGIEIGIVGGGYNEVRDITVCTPMSVTKELALNANVLMFDEAHNIPSATISSVAASCVNAYYRIGVSATPWRDGGDDLLIEAALSIRKPHLSINASKLIAKGKLTPCNIVFIPFKETYKWNESYSELYNRAIVKNERRNNVIAKIASNMTFEKGRTTLILIKNVKHGDIIKEKLIQANEDKTTIYFIDNNPVEVSTIDFLSGRDSKERRKAVLQAVKEGFTKILIGSTIADEGLDLPILDCLILAGSGKSSTRAFQRIGRVLRLYKNKENAIVFDFMDETPTFKRHALTRKALYQTEPLWNIKILEKQAT